MVEERGGKKTLQPKFTKGYSHIPQLREKLRWLYGYHPIVKTQYQLAKELNISAGTLSTWLTGVSYKDAVTVAPQNPDCIPTKHYRAFIDIWGLPAAILEMEDINEFKNSLATFESGRGPWEKFIRTLPDDEALEIVVNGEKGLIDPEDKADQGVLQLLAGDEIMLRVDNPGLQHGVLLMQDRFGWTSLRPNPRWTATEVDGTLVFPRQAEDAPARFAELDSVGGMHRALAIFTREALPVSVLDILRAQPLDIGGLNHVAGLLQGRIAAGASQCQVVSRRFLVSTGRRRKPRSSVIVPVNS
jgi:hypothetical protein